MAKWYKTLLAFWLLLGLPVIVLGYGFSGGDLAFPHGDPFSILMWIVVAAFLLSPVLLSPFRKRTADPADDGPN